MGPGRGRGGRAMMRGRGRGGRFRGRGMRKLTRTLAFILGTMQTERGSGKRRRWSWPKHWNALPSPLEDAYSDALHTNHMIEYEPAVDIDEKPPMSILEAPEKCKPFLMAYEVIQSQEELELHEVDKKELMDVYCGPDRVTAKQQKQELERVAKTLPEDTPSSVRRFADQALLSPQVVFLFIATQSGVSTRNASSWTSLSGRFHGTIISNWPTCFRIHAITRTLMNGLHESVGISYSLMTNLMSQTSPFCPHR
ncbi:protein VERNALIZATION INSENSITIVE [Musa troglodytarum]|uniref:Protein VERNALIZATION INSENSITIVE n=1 Tax=Musa troglodytarum TaxID=320322 RepID=A0A9E7HFC9_9LILI|nr:protein VERNALIZATION INSENSITIVE [Musa troglodytarum]